MPFTSGALEPKGFLIAATVAVVDRDRLEDLGVDRLPNGDGGRERGRSEEVKGLNGLVSFLDVAEELVERHLEPLEIFP